MMELLLKNNENWLEVPGVSIQIETADYTYRKNEIGCVLPPMSKI